MDDAYNTKTIMETYYYYIVISYYNRLATPGGIRLIIILQYINYKPYHII